VSAELAHELEQREPRTRSARVRIVGLLGPTIALAGLLWAIAQPERITLLHPYAQGFWWLLSEPPLFVVVAGLAFHRFVARGLVDDLEKGA
jgi:hypothetical protein